MWRSADEFCKMVRYALEVMLCCLAARPLTDNGLRVCHESPPLYKMEDMQLIHRMRISGEPLTQRPLFQHIAACVESKQLSELPDTPKSKKMKRLMTSAVRAFHPPILSHAHHSKKTSISRRSNVMACVMRSCSRSSTI